MLNKKVCQECNNRGRMHFAAHMEWNKHDERWWKEYGEVFCRYSDGGLWKRIPVDASPPAKCPFIVEHVVSQGC